MAFTLTSFQAWAKPPTVPVSGITKQYVRLVFTGTASDVAINFGDAASAFYTDIDATSVGVAFGELMAKIRAVSGIVLSSNSELKSPQIVTRLKVASLTTTGQYSFAVVNNCPSVAFNAGNGDTSYQMEIEWLLPQNSPGFTLTGQA